MLLDGCWCVVPLHMLSFHKLSGRQTMFVLGSIEVSSRQADWNILVWNLVVSIALVHIEPEKTYIHIITYIH